VSGLGVAWRVLRAEGARSVVERAADRAEEARRRRSFPPAPAGWQPAVPIPVLNLAATPPAPRLGGVQVQLLRRLEAEARQRPVALLYGETSGAWRLEVGSPDGRRASLSFPGGAPAIAARAPVETPLEDPAFAAAVAAAVERTGARAVHAEGLAGLPLASLLGLARQGLPLVLTLHDFAAFCPRPHLLEQPVERFCDYSRDLRRCARCLGWPEETEAAGGALQARRRETAGELLAAAAALVFVSAFLRSAHRDLFPGLDAGRQRVIAPAESGEPPLSSRPSSGGGPLRHLRHVALIGAPAHKGAAVFAAVVAELAGLGLRWSVYGGGEAAQLARLRSLPSVTVRGYYRNGTLPRRLRRDRVDLALLLSIVPESYGLALGECAAAGVPVLAFDHGALGERIRSLGAGWLVALSAGPTGVAAAIRAMRQHGLPPAAPAAAVRALPGPAEAAAAHAGLYRELGWITP